MNQHNGNGASAVENQIDATLIAGSLDVFDHDGHFCPEKA